jgi:energy-coupling factor transporter ATP-binding protein EcfA2
VKINVIGTSGSGKSTFAKALAQQLAIPYIEMDTLFWKPHWTGSSDAELFEKLEQAISQPSWVLDGNYKRSQPIKLSGWITALAARCIRRSNAHCNGLATVKNYGPEPVIVKLFARAFLAASQSSCGR